MDQLAELLQSLGKPWPSVVATEGWAPNLSVATRPFGVEVIADDPESEPRMPLPDAGFDLVMNRHEALDPREIARVLRPDRPC